MKPGRILIVEDEARGGRDYQSTLIRLGHSVPVVARTGEEALAAAVETHPDLVLLSLRLEGPWNGIETARRIREVFDTAILFLCQPGDDLSMNRARVAFPYGYLVGPVSGEELQDAVESALTQSGDRALNRRRTQMVGQTLRALDQGVVAADLAGNISFMNKTAERLTGWEASAALGRPVREVFEIQPPNGEAPPAGHSFLRRKDGKRLVIEVTTGPLESEDGGLNGMVTTFRESSPTATAATTHAGDLELAAMTRSIADPMIGLDASWRINFANPAAAKLFGVSLQALSGRGLWEEPSFFDPIRHRPEFEKALRQRRPQDIEVHLKDTDVWLHVRLYPHADGVLAILRNETERKKRELEARRLERLEGLGLLARGFAHDFNNLLTVMLGSLSFAKDRPAGDPRLPEELGQAIDATLEAQSLVQQLMTFATGGKPIKSALKPSALVQHLVEDRRGDHPRINYLITSNGAQEATVQADPKQISRLVENLLLNAEQAVGQEGDIFIQCHEETDAHARPTFVIEVIDSGEGMAADVVKQAFEPFFTTRRESNATGLGLTVCESIARAHGGSVTLQSKPGQGTVAIVHLPIASYEESPLLMTLTPPSNHGAPNMSKDGHARILVLEDEALIRKLISTALSQAGHEVIETKEGKETIEVYRKSFQEGHPYDLLIMDLTIEDGMGGIEAIARIKEIDPNARAIVSSGYSDEPAMSNPAAYGFSGVLPKPYQPQQLIEVVRGLVS